METLTQMANTAAKAVWGDESTQSHEEPISGATGDVSKGEPYDAGNMEPRDQHKVESDLGGNRQTSTDTATDAPTGGQDEHRTLNRDTAVESSKPLEAGNDNDAVGANKPLDAGKNNRAVDANKPADASKEKASEKTADVNPEEGDSQTKLEGRGPRPVEILAKEHGGDAGAMQTENESSSSPEAKESSGESKGTGEEYVQTTGLAADGGDFDATKPGAGREADRLMEQKGMHGEEGDKSGGSHGGLHSSHGKDKDKPSLGERLKNKLHKH